MSLAFISAIDVHGGMTDEDLPFQLEVDEIKASGPTVSTGPVILWSLVTNTLILTWNSPAGTALGLQSTLSLPPSWVNETNVQTNGTFSVSVQSTTGTNKFFRVASPSATSLAWKLKGYSFPSDVQIEVSGNSENVAFPFRSKGLAPPTNSLFTNNFIDVSSYFVLFQAYHLSANGGNPISRDEYWITQFGDHNGGGVSRTNTYYESLTEIPSFPFWLRTSDCVTKFMYTTAYALGDSNWPGGWSVTTSIGCHGGTNVSNYESPLGVPWRHFTDLFEATAGGSSSADAYTNLNERSEDTRLHLHTAYKANRVTNFLLLSATARNIPGWEAPQVIYYDENFINSTNITLLGEALNADGKTFRQVRRNSTYDATPSVLGTTNYWFDVSIESHRKVELSRSYHPLFEVRPFTVPIPQLGTIQPHYDNASVFLGRDDDEKIADSDPSAASSTNANSVFRSDDVPAYVEFGLTNGPLITNVLTRAANRPVFPAALRSAKYYRIEMNSYADTLLGWTGANIKLVKSLKYNGGAKDGIASRPSNPATMIIIHTLPNVVGAHEWAHTLGLTHRGEADNYGPLSGALMNLTNYSNGYEINRYERGYIQ